MPKRDAVCPDLAFVLTLLPVYDPLTVRRLNHARAMRWLSAQHWAANAALLLVKLLAPDDRVLRSDFSVLLAASTANTNEAATL